MARLYCVAGLILFIKVELSLDENQVSMFSLLSDISPNAGIGIAFCSVGFL